MRRLLRLIAAVGLAACAPWSMAGKLWLEQADGKLVSVIDGGAAGPFRQQQLERRLPDGRIDEQFGRGGRVIFSLGGDNLGPRSLRTDARGRLLVVGTAFDAADRSVPATVRLLPEGRLDPAWGGQGRSLVPSAGTDATGADVLGMDDDSVLVFGEVESPTGDRPALWRLRGDGAIDPGFGERGVWMPAELDGALALGLARDDDGAALIAVEREDRDSTWLEAYRWRPGMGELQRVARQAAPPEWRGPVSLERRGGLQWFDTSADVGIPLEQANLAAAPSADASSLGGVAFNPFAAADTPAAPVVEVHEDESRWLAWSAGLLVAAMLAAGWWRYRRPAVVDLGLLDTRQAQVEVALRDLRAASPPPPEPHAQERLERHDAGAPAASAPAPAQATEPDDLKRIKGIGPVLEAKLHAADVRHFRQIAAWTDDDIARFEARSTSFRGRVKRDAWIAQAAELARAADSASSPPTR